MKKVTQHNRDTRAREKQELYQPPIITDGKPPFTVERLIEPDAHKPMSMVVIDSTGQTFSLKEVTAKLYSYIKKNQSKENPGQELQ